MTIIKWLITGFVGGGIIAYLLFFFLRERDLHLRLSALQSEKSLHDQQYQQVISEIKEKEAKLLEVSQEKAAAVQKALEIPKLEERVQRLQVENASYLQELSELRSKQAELSATLREEQKAWDEKLALLKEAEKKLGDAFEALSVKVLRSSQEDFLREAAATLGKFHQKASGELEKREQAVGELVKPIKEMLVKYESQVQEMEKARREAYGGLREQVQSLLVSQQKLQAETGNLVKALRTPQVRGRWGEITLKRVAELSGMVEHCDFYEQEDKVTPEGRLRPDMIVRLPGEKQIVVDAKVPLMAYLEAMECEDETMRKTHLKDHARQVQTHIMKLANKAYWDQFNPTPEFVVLFIPGENFFSAALEQNPNLIEEGVQRGVILSTPTTLISLLKAVSYGWRQEKMAQNAQVISDLGKMLHERIAIFSSHMSDLGKHLGQSIQSYNKAVGSLESRVLPATRKFREMGISSKNRLEDIKKIEKVPRTLQIDEDMDIPKGRKKNS